MRDLRLYQLRAPLREDVVGLARLEVAGRADLPARELAEADTSRGARPLDHLPAVVRPRRPELPHHGDQGDRRTGALPSLLDDHRPDRIAAGARQLRGVDVLDRAVRVDG